MAVKSKKEIKESVKNEVQSWFNKDFLDKVKRTLEYLPIPCGVILGIWGGADLVVYVEAGLAVLISIVSFIELFVKD